MVKANCARASTTGSSSMHELHRCGAVAKLTGEHLFQRQKITPSKPLLQRTAQQKGRVKGGERPDLTASGVVFEPAPARFGDSFFGRKQRLRCRLPETDEDIGIGKLDLPMDEG